MTHVELGRLGRLINVGDWLASCGPTDLGTLTTNLLENAANLSRGHPTRGHIIACGARCGWGSETTLRCLEEQYQPQATEARIRGSISRLQRGWEPKIMLRITSPFSKR